MSILIRGMEMPKDGCMDCPVHKWTFAGEMCCITDEIVGGNVERGGFPPNCPLISVPEHGDLIDRDAFRYEMDKNYPFDKATQSRHGIEDVLKSAILQMLFDSPTIIPADNFEKLLTDHPDMCCEVEPKDYPPYLDYPKERKPMTNYDRLISKTPEELVEWIESIEPAACPWRDDHGDNCRFTHCRDCWLSWLKSPVEEQI